MAGKMGNREKRWMKVMRKSHRHISDTDCISILTTCFLFSVFTLRSRLKSPNLQITCWIKGTWGGDSLQVCLVYFHTCGSRAAAVSRWGCRQPASSAGETASRFWSPASERSSDRSYAPGSPYTRYALKPSSPDRDRGRWQREKRCRWEDKKNVTWLKERWLTHWIL